MPASPRHFLDFEAPIEELERKLAELKTIEQPGDQAQKAITAMGVEVERKISEIYGKLSTWHRVQIARHPDRPQATDFVGRHIADFQELHGDRQFGDDKAILTGIGRFDGEAIIVVAHVKGRDTEERMMRNFGMPNPEGLRKARRMFAMASKFGIPVLSLVDTPGAYPGVAGEERSQNEAIAENLTALSVMRAPHVVVVTGEGGSGGALALGVGDHLMMMENAIYSVATPEACAAIVWRDAGKAKDAANAMRLDAPSLHKLGLVEELIPEPLGGAHRDPKLALDTMAASLKTRLSAMRKQPIKTLVKQRYERLISLGAT